MITKRTFWMLLPALTLGLLLEAWSLGHRDVCSPYLAGLGGPATQIVSQGRQSVEISCEQWFPRQPLPAQAVCLVVLVLALVTLLSFCFDLISGFRARRASRTRA